MRRGAGGGGGTVSRSLPSSHRCSPCYDMLSRCVDRRTAMQSPCALRLGCILNFCSKTFCIDPLDTRVLWPAPGTREPQESQSLSGVACRCRVSLSGER